MQKDVIYIDVDDDITGIIGKVKASNRKIVALVPPKRIGVLQSAVNLRLVNRAADQSGKRLVVISNNPALSALAAAASIPVAKNLQSKPELAKVADTDDTEEDVIDGAALPVGEHVDSAATDAEVAAAEAEGESTEADTQIALDEAKKSAPVVATGVAAAAASKPKKTPSKLASVSNVKIPNFNTFRKKLVLIGGGVVLLIALLVWGFFFAPNARIIVAARTTDVAVTDRVTLGPELATDQAAKTLKSITKSVKKDVTKEFTATGKKDVGEKATGAVTFRATSEDAIVDGATIPAGTTVTSSSGATYVTNAAANIPATSARDVLRGRSGSATVAITASASGASYNGATGTVTGPSGVSSTISTTTSGGTDKTITVVTQADIDGAKQQAVADVKSDAVRKELLAQFKDSKPIEASIKSEAGELKSSIGVDQEATSGKAVLSGAIVYKMDGVAKSELSKYLDASMRAEIDGKPNQRIYENGAKSINFTNVNAQDGVQANISTNGKVGPKINEDELKEFAKGKRYGEIQAHVEAISGVDSADVKFSPFWVGSAPNDAKRIKVEFKIND